jgi:peptidoglycan/LPS O-acetylase OafA/YrhL
MKRIRNHRHTVLMAAGCVAMLLAVYVLTTTTTNAGSWGVYLLFLLCPAMHLLMHRGGHDHSKKTKGSGLPF